MGLESSWESENTEDIHLLEVEDFEGLEKMELVPYDGEGSTSYAAKYDKEKLEYLEKVGVSIPKEWLNEKGEVIDNQRAMVITAFIVTGIVEVTGAVKKALNGDKEAFEKIVMDRNRQMVENRSDRCGYRQQLPDGLYVEDIFRQLNLSANPEKRVSVEELEWTVQYVLTALKSHIQE